MKYSPKLLYRVFYTPVCPRNYPRSTSSYTQSKNNNDLLRFTQIWLIIISIKRCIRNSYYMLSLSILLCSVKIHLKTGRIFNLRDIGQLLSSYASRNSESKILKNMYKSFNLFLIKIQILKVVIWFETFVKYFIKCFCHINERKFFFVQIIHKFFFI